jgi:hypothetical protein
VASRIRGSQRLQQAMLEVCGFGAGTFFNVRQSRLKLPVELGAMTGRLAIRGVLSRLVDAERFRADACPPVGSAKRRNREGNIV